MHPPLGACLVWTRGRCVMVHPTPGACMCARRCSQAPSIANVFEPNDPGRVALVEMSCARLHASTLGCLSGLDAWEVCHGAPHTRRMHVCKALQPGALNSKRFRTKRRHEGGAG